MNPPYTTYICQKNRQIIIRKIRKTFLFREKSFFTIKIKLKSNRILRNFLIKVQIEEKLLKLRGINPAWQRELSYTTNQYSE